MNLRFKNIIYTLGLLSAMFLVWHYRQTNQATITKIVGETMGTTYHISYFDEQQRDFKAQIDSLLGVFNHSLNTYLPDSEISQFNISGSFVYELPYFYPVLEGSREVFQITDGAFDPTVMPLVSAWGFGPQEGASPDSLLIDSLKQYVGFRKVISFDDYRVEKKTVSGTLDFSAIAKGYGVDVIATFLKQRGIEHLFVEIGGEVVVRGKNIASDTPWKIAIVNPESDVLTPTFVAYATLENQAVATSANNFNYRIINGVKYSHTISPHTGYPIVHKILSATVFASDCMRADALATSFMVMGHEKAIELLEKNTDIDAFLIFSDGNGAMSTYATEGVKSQIELL